MKFSVNCRSVRYAFAAAALSAVLAACGSSNSGSGSPPEQSSDATLSALELSAAALNETFDSATTDYTASVDHSVDSTTVTATASDDGAIIEVNGAVTPSAVPSDPVSLTEGDTTISVTVTAGDATTTETYNITVTRAAPPIASVTVLVLDNEGRLVSGATLTTESTGEQATTGDDGRATLPVARESRELVRIDAPGYLGQKLPLHLAADAEPGVFKTALIQAADPVQIAAAENGGSATGADGASVTVPAGALVDGSGQPVTGSVDVFITPVDIADDRSFLAFPGGFEAVDAGGNDGFMLTFGTVDFRFEQNGELLELAAGQTAGIEIPLYVPNDADGTPLSQGAALPLWSLDETTSVWTEEVQGTVVASAGSPTGLALNGEVTHFSWWNADRFRNLGEISVIVDCSGLGASCGAEVALPGMNLSCDGGDDGGPRYFGSFALSGGATAPVLPVPGDTDMDCDVDTDGAYAADTSPDPVNAAAATVLPVDVILKPAHESDGFFVPGERLRGEMTIVGELHTFHFNGLASEIFHITAYPAADGLSEPGLTGNLGASVSIYSGTTLLEAATFESTAAGNIEIELPAGGEFEVHLEAQGKVPGWYVAETELRTPGLSGTNGKVAFLALDRSDGSLPGERLFTVPEGASPYLELTDEFANVFETDGVRRSPPTFSPQRDLPYYQEVTPGKIVYLADHDVPGRWELYSVDLSNPGVATRLSGAETADGEISEFKVSPGDPTRIVYRVGGEDSGNELWFVDTDDPGNAVRIGEPSDDPNYDGRQRHFEFADSGTAVVYQAGSTVESRLNDGDLYLVYLDNPGVATRLSGALDADAGENIQRFDWRGAVSRDGSLVAYVADTVDEPGVLYLAQVNDPGNPAVIEIEPLGEDRIIGVQITPDGTRLTAVRDRFDGAGNGQLYLVDITDPAAPGAPEQLDDFVKPSFLWLSPDSTFALEWAGDRLRRFGFATPGSIVTEWNFPAPASVARLRFTADGAGVVVQLQDDSTGLDQLYHHVLGEPADTQTRLGPRTESMADSDYGVIYFDLAEDGKTLYYMADISFRVGEIFQTTLTDPDGDRLAVAESVDDYLMVHTPSDGRIPLFIILEPGQNPEP